MLRSSVLSVAVLTALGAVVAQAQQPAVTPAQGTEHRAQSMVIIAPNQGAEHRAQSMVIGTVKPPSVGEYWLGVMCFPADPALRAQLNLSEKQGLVVMHVVPKSPAAKAGISQHDVLLRIGDRPLGNPRDLVEAVKATKETEKKIELIRGGNRQTIVATLAKRPEEARRTIAVASAEDDWMIVQKWVEGMRPGQKGAAGRPPVRFHFFHPGAIVSQSVFVQKPMPANMSVIVTKNGDQPMQIEIRRADDKWVLTDKSLDKLPDDVRPFVERMVGRGAIGFGELKAFVGEPNVMISAMPGAPGGNFTARLPHPGQMHGAPLPGLDPRLERRFDEMNRRMDQMLKMMEKMMKDHHGQPPENDD